MAFRAVHRYARISARKVRPLADLVRGKFADDALVLLRFQPHRGARMLEKVIQSAVGSAQDTEQNGGRSFSADELVVVEARIDGGPMFKRFQPRSRGQAFTILKRSSHITVELKRLEEM